METQKVVLYYPNNWKRFIGDLAPPSEKRFNWFLCSKRYKDPKTGFFVAEIGRGTKFYEESTGKTLVIPFLPEEKSESGENPLPGFRRNPEKIILWIVKEDETPSLKQIKDYGYHGLARLLNCKLGDKASDEFVVCKEAEFEFLVGILEDSQKEKFCPIIDFSKRNNNCIRSKVPDFPTPEEIDEVLQISKCSVVCRILYDYIYLYLSAL